MKLTTLPEPLLEFGTGTHVCPRTGIEHLGVYDKRDELRRTELRNVAEKFRTARPEIGEAGDVLFGRRSRCPMEMDGGHARLVISSVLTNNPKLS
jgi:hypothetical protein